MTLLTDLFANDHRSPPLAVGRPRPIRRKQVGRATGPSQRARGWAFAVIVSIVLWGLLLVAAFACWRAILG